MREIHHSQLYLSVCWVCFVYFFMFGMLLSFQYVKNCWRSHILILHVLQEASSMLVIQILKLLDIQGYISDCLWSLITVCFLLPFIIFIVLLPFSMNFKFSFSLNFNTISLFQLSWKQSFCFLPIKEKWWGLLELTFKM